MRVRSGSCGGLDVVLADGRYVNCPVAERFAASSPLELVALDDERVAIAGSASIAGPVPVELPDRPAFYPEESGRGDSLARVGQLCSDRLGIGMTNICTHWRSRARRCKFCSIGLNVATEDGHKSRERIVAAATAAFSDPRAPARHVLLGGGTPAGRDAGAAEIAAAAAMLKRRWPHPIYAMLAPPQDLVWLERLHAAGVDEIGMNIELWSAAAARHYMPGKHEAIDRDLYLGALRRAVELFGPVNTRSILIAGLEPIEETLAGVDVLASMGVMPILSPFRPLVGTELEDHPRLSAPDLARLATEATEVAGRYGMPLGPTCIPCQANTVTLPGHPLYRYY